MQRERFVSNFSCVSSCVSVMSISNIRSDSHEFTSCWTAESIWSTWRKNTEKLQQAFSMPHVRGHPSRMDTSCVNWQSNSHWATLLNVLFVTCYLSCCLCHSHITAVAWYFLEPVLQLLKTTEWSQLHQVMCWECGLVGKFGWMHQSRDAVTGDWFKRDKRDANRLNGAIQPYLWLWWD